MTHTQPYIPNPEVTIYTDGGCYPNPGPGGWGAVLHHHHSDEKLELFGGMTPTTNNQMELMAAIRGLEELKRSCRVVLFTDSQYVKFGITRWMKNWLRRGWVNSEGNPVKNRGMWEELNELNQKHTIRWQWIRGHTGVEGNEAADRLATAGRLAVVAKPGSTELRFRRGVEVPV